MNNNWKKHYNPTFILLQIFIVIGKYLNELNYECRSQAHIIGFCKPTEYFTSNKKEVEKNSALKFIGKIKDTEFCQ